MVTRLLCLLTLAAILAAPGAHAHVGDQIYPFFELLDEDMDLIDLTDGSVDDWLEVIGEPSLTASDFHFDNGGYDPSDVDFRIWLAWNQSTSTLWIAMERFDDLYFNLYDGEETWKMYVWDSNIRFMVDGDHAGGGYDYPLGLDCAECTAEQDPGGQPSSAAVDDDRRTRRTSLPLRCQRVGGQGAVHRHGGRRHRPDPGDHGHRAQGDTPSTTSSTMTRTPPRPRSSALARPSGSRYSLLTMTIPSGKTRAWEEDLDVADRQHAGPETRRLPIVDGLLIGAGEDPSLYDDPSAVEPSSWARIKASF